MNQYTLSNYLCPKEEEDKTKSDDNKIKKNAINFAKCFGIKKKNAKKKS